MLIRNMILFLCRHVGVAAGRAHGELWLTHAGRVSHRSDSIDYRDIASQVVRLAVNDGLSGERGPWPAEVIALRDEWESRERM